MDDARIADEVRLVRDDGSISEMHVIGFYCAYTTSRGAAGKGVFLPCEIERCESGSAATEFGKELRAIQLD